jgi:hypothetical protein
MSRRSHRAKAATWTVAEREVDGVEDRAGTGGCSVPRSLTRNRIRIETAAASGNKFANLFDVSRIVRHREIVGRRVSRLDVLNAMKQLGLFA